MSFSDSLGTLPSLLDTTECDEGTTKKRVTFCNLSDNQVYYCQWKVEDASEFFDNVWYSKHQIEGFRQDLYTTARKIREKERFFEQQQQYNVEDHLKAASNDVILSWSQLVAGAAEEFYKSESLDRVRGAMSTTSMLTLIHQTGESFFDFSQGVDPILVGTERWAIAGLKTLRTSQKTTMYEAVDAWQMEKDLTLSMRTKLMRKACRELSRPSRLLAVYLARLLVTTLDE